MLRSTSFLAGTGPRSARHRVPLVTAFVAVLVTLNLSVPQAAMAAPSNDDVAGAVAVSTLPYSDTTETGDATSGPGDSGCGVATVWYAFTPGADGRYLITTQGSDYDTTLAAFEGPPPSGTFLACNDDSSLGVQSVLVLDLTAGTTYYFEAGTCCGLGEPGQVGPGGTLVFNVTEAPPPLTAEFTVDKVITDRQDQFTATGTITCSQQGVYWGDGSVRQAQGLAIYRGSFYVSGVCGTEPTTWTATGTGNDRVLLTKRARVTVSYFVCNEIECIQGAFAETLRVTRR